MNIIRFINPVQQLVHSYSLKCITQFNANAIYSCKSNIVGENLPKKFIPGLSPDYSCIVRWHVLTCHRTMTITNAR
jgi:hypothetical protein